MNTQIWIVILGVLLFAPSVSVAQEAPRPTSSNPTVGQPELVLIPIIVKDRKGHPIRGLKKQDFQVRDDGEPKEVNVFREVTGIEKLKSTETTPGAYSNFAAGDGNPRRVTIVVIDLLSTTLVRDPSAKKEVLKALAKTLPRDEPIELLEIGKTKLQQIHALNNDSNALIHALSSVSGERTASTGPASDPLQASPEARITFESLKNFLARTQDDEPVGSRAESVRGKLIAMQQIARVYAGLPGRKNVLWITGGFSFRIDNRSSIDKAERLPVSISAPDPQMITFYERTCRVLNDAGLAVYPIEFHSLADRQTYLPDLGYSGNRGMRRSDEVAMALTDLAKATGGVACVGGVDLSGCLNDAVRDSEAYYLLGVDMTKESRTLGWHKLKVDVNPDHRELRSSSGYYFRTKELLEHTEVKQEILDALRAQLDYTDLHLEVRWEPVVAKEGKRDVAFKVSAEPSGIDSRPPRGPSSFEIAAAVVDGNGKFISGYSRNLTGQSPAPHRIEYHGELALEPGRYLVKFVVRDNLKGAIGTLSAPLTVQ